MDTDYDVLLRPMEVARILGLGRSTCYAMLQRGELPVLRVRNQFRTPRRELEAWIEQGLRESTAP